MGDDVLDPCDLSFSIRPAIALLDSTMSIRIAIIALLDGSSPGGFMASGSRLLTHVLDRLLVL